MIRLFRLNKTRQKYMDMYTDDLISRTELNEKIGGNEIPNRAIGERAKNGAA